MNAQSDQAAATGRADKTAAPIPWPLRSEPPPAMPHRRVGYAREMADAYRLLVY